MLDKIFHCGQAATYLATGVGIALIYYDLWTDLCTVIFGLMVVSNLMLGMVVIFFTRQEIKQEQDKIVKKASKIRFQVKKSHKPGLLYPKRR